MYQVSSMREIAVETVYSRWVFARSLRGLERGQATKQPGVDTGQRRSKRVAIITNYALVVADSVYSFIVKLLSVAKSRFLRDHTVH
jgi:hypothetical protein